MIAALSMVLFTGPAFASPYDQAFVDAFAEACVPGRLSYEATLASARSAGWAPVARTDHPELASVMQKSDEALAAETELEMTNEGALFARDVAGTRHHLSVTRSRFVMDAQADPWVMVGCALYNFDAVAPLDPAPVTALVGKAISRTVAAEGLIGHVWGPPCALPRTSDTYLGYIAEGGAMVATTGFSGIALNFSTSTPDPGEHIPETYC